MKRIEYQCSNCGQRFVTSAIPGVPEGMYINGNRAVGDAFYCADCVKSWPERNGEEFDRQYRDPQKMFAAWWNNTVAQQTKDKAKIKKYRHNLAGDYVEC